MKWILCLPVFILLVGFSSFCYAEDPIKLHIIVHSHMDEGWLFTFEQYYQGTKNKRGRSDDSGGCVKCILDNVFTSLRNRPQRKYQMAETAFFKRWWSDQNEDVKASVRKLIEQKQFEFVNGGWSANDEACTYYEDIIDNFITGHRWLYNEFGVDPNVAWQVDSFGHSATHAALMAQAGYDGIFFGRIDFRDWQQRRENQALEVQWRPRNPHNESILGHLLYADYSNTSYAKIKNPFACRSIFCYGSLNQEKYDNLKSEIMNRSKSYKTKNVPLLIGDDFHLWKQSEQDFAGIDDLIIRLSRDQQVNIQAKFSTISEYLREMTEDYAQKGSPKLPSKYTDYFPYIQEDYSHWVGYYTSKAMFKLKIRETSQYYNAAKLLLSKFLLVDSQQHSQIDGALQGMEEALGMVQHHDAVTGTMKEKVKHDYENLLDDARKNVEKEIIALLKDSSQESVGEEPTFVEGLDFNWRQKDPQITSVFNGKGNQANVLVTVFNPGHTDTFLLKIKAPNSKYKVLDDQNDYLVVDIICAPKQDNQDCYLYFVDEIPAFSFKKYILQPSTLSKAIPAEKLPREQQIKIGDQVTVQVGSDLRTFDYQLCSGPDSEKPVCLHDTFNLNYEYYEGNVEEERSKGNSGAYIFIPKDNEKHDFSPILSGKIYQGRHITIIQIERENLRTDIRFVHHELERGIEIESYFNPVNESKPTGKEIVLMIRSKEVKNNDQTFFTDQNGYNMQGRKINYRDFEIDLPEEDFFIPNNYYPITSAIYIRDPKTKLRMTVVTDRSQGATSLNPGEVEIMIHRQCIKDDAKGLMEELIEVDPEGGPLKVSTRHFIIYSSPQYNLKDKQRVRQYKLDRPLQYFLANVKSSSFAKPSVETSHRALNLESNIKLSIRSYNINEYVVRFHNLDSRNSKIVQIYNVTTKSLSLLNDFADRDDLKLSSISELSLFTHKLKEEIQKNKLDSSQANWKNANDGKDFSSIELLPMEIRSFKIVLSG